VIKKVIEVMNWTGFSNGQDRLARRVVTPHLPAALRLRAGGRYGRVVLLFRWNELMGEAVRQQVP
jgi:hypothetical protein